MEYTSSLTRRQLFRLETRRSMDKSPCQHIRFLQVRREIYRHMTLIKCVVETWSLPRTQKPLPEEQALYFLELWYTFQGVNA